jgi:hypothetical protein
LFLLGIRICFFVFYFILLLLLIGGVVRESIWIEVFTQLLAKAAHEASEIVVPGQLISAKAPVDSLMRVLLDLVDNIDLSHLVNINILVEPLDVFVLRILL